MRAAIVIGLVFLGAACGSDGGGSTDEMNFGQPTVPGVPVVQLDAFNFGYSVSTIRAQPGEQLTIEMTSTKDRHDLVLNDGATNLRIVHASEGVTAIGGLTAPTAPGTYVLYCSEIGHRSEGMVAELVVG